MLVLMDTLATVYVEDDEQEAFIMQVGMRRQNIRIFHIPDIAPETISQLQAPPYDEAVAIIFDALLSGQNGVELARELRTQGDQRPIFLLTAAENPDPALLRQHNIHYLRKPPNFEKLAALIRDLSDS